MEKGQEVWHCQMWQQLEKTKHKMSQSGCRDWNQTLVSTRTTFAFICKHQQMLKSRDQEKDYFWHYIEPQFFKCNLWKFVHKAHNMAPRQISKATHWNMFVNELLWEIDTNAQLDLSSNSILLTRFGKGPDQQEENSVFTCLRSKNGLQMWLCYMRLKPYYTKFLLQSFTRFIVDHLP